MTNTATAQTQTTCDICHTQIAPGETFSDDGSEIAHTDCVRNWFSTNYGRETLR